MSSEIFLNLGNLYTKTKSSSSMEIKIRRFKSFFGVSPEVCSIVWEKLKFDIQANSKPKYLLWTLFFLKQYPVETTTRSIIKDDEKTMRKWTWIFIEHLANLEVVFWEKRFGSSAPGQTCFCSLDGVDFRIMEPTPFHKRWYSHKFRGPGLRYEIGLNVRTGSIVWKHGGYPCGDYPNLKLAREAYCLLSVIQGELTLADKGYTDKKYFILPNERNSAFHKLIMSRHETVNKRIRQFHILKDRFRNRLDKHPKVFHAVVNLTQLVIENGEPLFSVFNV